MIGRVQGNLSRQNVRGWGGGIGGAEDLLMHRGAKPL
jgi:hypothetical protein